jgi:hypothetical protein
MGLLTRLFGLERVKQTKAKAPRLKTRATKAKLEDKNFSQEKGSCS